MTQYSTNANFSTDASGTAAYADGGANSTKITGFTALEPTGAPATFRTSTITAGGIVGADFVRLADGGWGNIAQILAQNGPGNIAAGTATEVLFHFRLNAIVANVVIGAFLRFLTSNSFGYALSITSTASAVQLIFWHGVTPWSGVGATVTKNLVAGTWYWARVNVDASGNWNWRIWAGSFSSEPGSWDVSGAADTSQTSGYVGPAAIVTSDMPIDYDWFSSATGVDSAPGPAAAPVSQYVRPRNRPRPGRGPFSKGRFFVQRLDAYTSLARIYNVSIAESASAIDSLSAQLTGAATLSETVAVSDTESAQLIGSATIAEAASASDSLSALGTFAAALAESGAAADTVSAIATFVVSLAESDAAVDTLTQGSIYNVTLSESGAAADTISALANVVAALAEAANAVDSVSATLDAAAAVSEAGAAVDGLRAAFSALASLAESGNAVDALVGTSSMAVAIVEAANAQDAIQIVQLAMPFDAERMVALPYGKRMMVLAYGKRIEAADYDRRLTLN